MSSKEKFEKIAAIILRLNSPSEKTKELAEKFLQDYSKLK